MMNINAKFLQKLSLLLSIFGGTNGFLWQGDKCTTWIKTDGSGCRINSFFNFEKLAMNYKRKTTGENICCNDGTGCFSTEKDTPWECHLELPSCMDKVKPDFMVFKHDQTEQEPYQIDYFNLNSSVESLQLDDKPFFIIIHGYGRKWPLNWMFNIKDRLVKLGNNVMIVRWTGGSTDELGYFKAAANTRSVGAAVAMVAKSLQFHGRISLNRTTIIGFSLGGQTAGAAGRNLPGLRRIIGLDPAGPLFQCMDPRARLDQKDAQLVVAIHTHGDYFLMSGCGTLQQLGHVDFYVNGGAQQPGCKRGVPEIAVDVASLNFGALAEDVQNVIGPACSHNRAPPYLIEFLDQALDPNEHCQFRAFPCASTEEWTSGHCFQCPADGCPRLSLNLDYGAFRYGKFYFNTMAENVTTGRYCGRQLLFSISSEVTVKGRITLTFRQEEKSSSPIVLQEINDLLVADIPKSLVIVVPWEMSTVEQVDLLYNRNKLLFTGGPYSWQIKALTLQDMDGVMYTGAIQKVKDGALTVIQFSASQN